MQKLFISRSLHPDSKILQRFSRASYHWTDRSLVQFSPVKFELPKSHWLFFYSPRAVHYFIQSYEQERVMDGFKCACFGRGTERQFIKDFGFAPQFTGHGKGKETANAFKKVLNEDSVTFIGGTTSMKSIQSHIGNEIEFYEQPVYHNEIIPYVELGYFEIAILTSPMNVQAFYRFGGSVKDLIVPGPSTAKEASKYPGKQWEAECPDETCISTAIDHVLSQQVLINKGGLESN